MLRSTIRRFLPRKGRNDGLSPYALIGSKVPGDSNLEAHARPQLTPLEFEKLLDSFDRSDPPTQSNVSRWVTKTAVDIPDHWSLLDTSYSRQTSGAHPLYCEALGAYHHARGECEDAAIYFRRLVSLRPSADAYSKLARCHAGGKNEEQGVQILTDAIARFPNQASLYMDKAAALFRLRRTSEANECLRHVLHALEGDKNDARDLIEECHLAVSNHLKIRDKKGDIYTDDLVRQLWWAYWIDMKSKTPFQQVNSWACKAVADNLASLLTTGATKRVVDFGVLCGEPNDRVARECPNVQIIGVDRQPLLEELNNKAYQRENLSFISADILDALPDLATRETLLFHSRTATVCYPEFMAELYKLCAKLGIERIALFEPVGLSREHLQYFDPGTFPRRSIAFRSVMFIHDYATMLKEAGYRVISEERSAYNHLFAELQGDSMCWMIAELS
jgi:tetratricopeptide (TPR) repeat protein